MLISLRWLREFVDLPTDDPAELSGVLNRLGLEVEGWRRVEPAFRGVIVAVVTAIDSHPGADRLRLVTLDTGSGPHSVVCGAWNFEVGATVPLALPGAVLPGGIEVGERSIRGVTSAGMICSEAELGLGEDSDGILVLDAADHPVGADFAATLPYPDVMFDLEVTPNRPDAMSVHGVARELAAEYRVPLRPPDTAVIEGGPATGASVRVEDPERCPRFTAREVRRLGVGPSPLWMRLRLRDSGVRPISNVVDVTNYVTLELGQPMHAFDLDRIPDETLVIRRAVPGERLTTLDSVERELTDEDLLVASPERGLALAGIMGGEDSEISAATTRILLEVAHFSAPHVLLSGWRQGLRTEASSRFERGVDPQLPPTASARAAALIARLAGGEVAPGFIDVYPQPVEPVVVAMPATEPRRLLGVDLGPGEVSSLLERLGFGVSGEDPLSVLVPTYRPDVTRPADLVEEVARIYGYDRIPATIPHGPGRGLSVSERRRRRIGSVMVGAGYHEIISFPFIGSAEMGRLGLDAGDRRAAPVAMRNPLSEDQRWLRTTLLPGLIDAVRVNQARNRPSVALYETGLVFFPGDGEVPDQPQRLAFVAAGRRPAPAWAAEPGERDATDAVGTGEMLARALGADWSVEQGDDPIFHPGRCGVVSMGGQPVGVVGEIHPATAARFDVAGRVAAGEFDLDALLALSEPSGFVAPSPFPPVVFDLAFELDENVPAGSLLAAVRQAGGRSVEEVRLFDAFTGPPLPPGTKSLAVRLTVRHAERTLTDDDVVPLRQAVSAEVEQRLGGRLRGGS